MSHNISDPRIRYEFRIWDKFEEKYVSATYSQYEDARDMLYSLYRAEIQDQLLVVRTTIKEEWSYWIK